MNTNAHYFESLLIQLRYYIQVTKCFWWLYVVEIADIDKLRLIPLLKMDIQLSIECILDYNFGKSSVSVM